MDTIDLHTHSTFSDGTFTPLQLVKYAEEKGLKAFALTDHDTTEGIKEAKSIETNVEVISGVEISTRYDKKEIHIVGLYVNENDADLNKQLKYYREKRVTRNFEILEKLNSLGVDITIDDVKESCTGDVISRAHIAKALVSKGFVGSYTEAFDRYLGDNKCAYVPRETLNYEESMELITKAGGVPVLAHPLLYKMSDTNLENMMVKLRQKGLKAVEVYYSTHSNSDTQHVMAMANRVGLIYSGGSDFHGATKPKIDMGTGMGKLAVPYEILEKIRGERNG
ncbi:MAG: PHP domain-containing protein [Lachnospirales bacterium]